MALTNIEEYKLKRMKRVMGPMTSRKALELAIRYEEQGEACVAFNPAFSLFAEQQRKFEEYALLLEKEEQS